MKWLLLAVLLAVPQTAPPTPRETTNSPTSGTNSVADKAQSDTTPTAPTLPVPNPIPANQNQNAAGTPQTKNAEQSITVSKLPSVSVSRDWADWVLWVFDGLLVLAGFLGIRVAYKTLKTIERQTAATEKAAEAALKQANHIVSSERAWISVTPHMGEVKFYPLRDNNAPIPDNLIDILPIAHLFPAKIVNVGKTPAKIEGSAIRYVLTKLHPSKWDATPDYGVLSEYVHYAFPNETLTITAELSPSPMMTQAQIDAVQNEREFLYAFGIVKYRDVYGEPHETQFGYLYKVQDRHLISRKDGVIETIRTGEARFRIDGPRAYNAHT